MENEEVRNVLNKVVNSHGDAFHHLVVQRLRELYDGRGTGISKWRFHCVEFPVKVNNHDTRLDIICEHGFSNFPFFLLGECKRVNRGLSNWCFVRTPLVTRSLPEDHELVFLECLRFTDIPKTRAEQIDGGRRSYNLAYATPTHEKGDVNDGGKGRQAIEDAATQICTGMNGFVEGLVAANRAITKGREFVYLLPVIFTTAKLFVSDVDVRLGDMDTGTIDLKTADFREEPWLLYQYHQSIGIKHKFMLDEPPSDISKLLEGDYIRTIPIVTPAGLESFLRWSSELL